MYVCMYCNGITAAVSRLYIKACLHPILIDALLPIHANQLITYHVQALPKPLQEPPHPIQALISVLLNIPSSWALESPLTRYSQRRCRGYALLITSSQGSPLLRLL